MSAGREREIDDRIVDWVDGRMTDRDRDRFVAELRVNPQLRRDLEEYERTVAAVRAALQAPTHRTQLADRVMAAIAEGRREPEVEGGGRNWRPWVWSLATAAALLVVALLVDAWSAPVLPDKSLATAKTESAARPEPTAPPEAQLRRVDQKDKSSAEPALDELLKTGVSHEREWDAGVKRRDAEVPATEPDANRLVRDGADPGESKEVVEEADEVAKARRLVVPGPVGPATGGPGAAPSPPPPGAPAAGAEVGASREAETGDDHDGLPVVTVLTDDLFLGATRGGAEAAPPAPATLSAEPAEPLPLVVVLGRAPAVAQRFAARARTERSAGSGARGGDDRSRRFDEFFTAQIAQLAQQEQEQKRSAKSAPHEDAPKAAEPLWVQVADLRLLALSEPPRAAAAPADRAPGRGDAATWTERDWLVEGSKQDIAALLGRLASFAGSSELELRTGETTDVAVHRVAGASVSESPRQLRDQAQAAGTLVPDPAPDTQRIVLRFRLQTH